VPRDHWLELWEKVAIISFHHQFPLEGYRRLTSMMLDRNVVAVSPSSTYRVLKAAGLLQRWNPKASRKGNGFQQPRLQSSDLLLPSRASFIAGNPIRRRERRSVQPSCALSGR
jgi:hypothetical protein